MAEFCIATHVYCINCKHFKIEEDTDGTILTPERCRTCYFYDFEDSKPFSVRWRYEVKE